MLTITKTQNINGTSRINDVDVANMYATINENGEVSINKNVFNYEVYKANMSEVQADMIEFETKVYAMQSESSSSDTTTSK